MVGAHSVGIGRFKKQNESHRRSRARYEHERDGFSPERLPDYQPCLRPSLISAMISHWNPLTPLQYHCGIQNVVQSGKELIAVA
jgi:hypothetical protein